jgi:hypothetical protein
MLVPYSSPYLIALTYGYRSVEMQPWGRVIAYRSPTSAEHSCADNNHFGSLCFGHLGHISGITGLLRSSGRRLYNPAIWNNPQAPEV